LIFIRRCGRSASEIGILAAGFHIDGHVAFALLERHLVGIGHLLANPARHVFGGGTEVEDLVHIAVIQFVLHPLFDVGEIGHHAILVEFFGAAVDRDDAIVPVRAIAFTLVVEMQLV